jgi:hypothetical protein
LAQRVFTAEFGMGSGVLPLAMATRPAKAPGDLARRLWARLVERAPRRRPGPILATDMVRGTGRGSGYAPGAGSELCLVSCWERAAARGDGPRLEFIPDLIRGRGIVRPTARFARGVSQ